METNLRPLTLGEILDRTAQLYRTHFTLFAGIFSIYAGVGLVLNLVQIGLGAAFQRTGVSAKLNWMVLTTAAIEWFLLVLLLGAALAAISLAVAWVHLGERATIRSAYAATLPRFGRYMGLMTITGLIAWFPLALLYGGYLGFVLLYVRPRGLLTHPNTTANPHGTFVFGMVTISFLLLFLPSFIYGVVMSLRYALAVPACVIENLKALKAIRRSVELSKGARGRIFILFLLIGVIKLGLVGVTQAFFLAVIFKNHGQVSPVVSAISQVVGFFTNTFLGPIGAAGITLFYYDQRVRKEGYDIEWMMQAAGLMPAVPEPAGDFMPPDQQSGPWRASDADPLQPPPLQPAMPPEDETDLRTVPSIGNSTGIATPPPGNAHD